MIAETELVPEGAYLMEKILARCHEHGSCLIWDGYLNGDSPRINVGGTHRPVRHVIFEQLVGPRDPRHEVIHTCGTRNCVAAAHLEQVDKAERRRRTAMSRYVSKHTGETTPLSALEVDAADAVVERAESSRARLLANAAVRAACSGLVPNSVFALGAGV